jgi:hypothetical protein
MFRGGLEWRPRPTPGCSAIEEEEEEYSVDDTCRTVQRLDKISNEKINTAMK